MHSVAHVVHFGFMFSDTAMCSLLGASLVLSVLRARRVWEMHVSSVRA